MSQTLFYDLDAVSRTAVNLFYGWGYNFYRKENQLRADDLMVRSRIGGILGEVRAAIETAEADYRRGIPAPTREKPRPDPDMLAAAHDLEALGQAVGALEGDIRALPAPESDLMTKRYRQEGQTLALLLAADEAMVGRAEMLRALVAGQDAMSMLDSRAAIKAGLQAVSEAVRQRRLVLA